MSKVIVAPDTDVAALNKIYFKIDYINNEICHPDRQKEDRNQDNNEDERLV
jgi:hypothetical protein